MSGTGNRASRNGGGAHERPARRPGGNKLLIAGLLGVAASIGLGLARTLSKSAARTAPAAGPGSSGAAARADGVAVLRDDSHRLSVAADGRVTMVEFEDFECEACGAVHSAIEQLRQRYQGRVTFVVRHFPLDAHANARRAARAAEAAAQQGEFEPMFQKLFLSQSEWGEQQPPQDDLFRSYAAELGLNLAQWDADYASAATAARVQADVDDGVAIGVTGTPSFFLNGQPLAPQSVDDLTRALDEALAA